jgi:hypothetical protein
MLCLLFSMSVDFSFLYLWLFIPSFSKSLLFRFLFSGICRLSNRQAYNTAPVFLDQVVLQYWFQGPEEPTAASAAALAAGDSSSSNGSSSSGVVQQEEAVAALVASQFKMSCSDASPAVGEWAAPRG